MDIPEPRLHVPPGWPDPPAGWRPPPGWRPPASWPPAPAGWAWWTDPPATPGAAATPDPVAPAPVRRLGYQVPWLVLFWTAFAVSLVFVLLAVTGEDVPGESVVVLATGFLAIALATGFATDLVRRGVPDLDFDAGTAWGRSASAGWLLLVVVLVVLADQAAASGLAPSDPAVDDIAVRGTQTITAQVIGAAALLGVLGPGYSEYRRARAGGRP